MANETVTTPAAAAVPVDLTNYVPKAEFDKVQTKANEAATGLEQLKNQLLDKDYLEYLETKRTPALKTPSRLPAVDLKNLDMEGLVALIQQHSIEAVTKAVAPQLKQLTGALTNVQAVIELEQVRRQYEDFDEHFDAVKGILESTPNELTIKQAYLMAKAQAPAKPATPVAPGKTPAPTPKPGERPGTTVPLDGDTIKVFKNSEDAAKAAAAEVFARHGLSGDTL